MQTFYDMGLPAPLSRTLSEMKFTHPTPIQAEAIPIALQGQDILGSAQTGTGKTAAFGIPLVAKIMDCPNSKALVMTPTRELAAQVMTQIKAMLGKQSKIQTALLIGGEPMPKQLHQLKRNPQIIVGTPGRITDHTKRGKLSLAETNFLVLDETDRMLDMGFTEQIDEIIGFMTSERQTLLFSATLPKNIVNAAKSYLKDPARVAVSQDTLAAPNIKQDTLHTKHEKKYGCLTDEIKKRQGTIIVFVKTKAGTCDLARKLSDDGFSADAIHGDLRQHIRDRVISRFRKRKYRVLVATDVASRGLDIPHIEHVINFDLPQCPEDYIHRIGRTARAGAEGCALNLITPKDKKMWEAIEHMLDPESHPKKKDKSFKKRPSKRRPKHIHSNKSAEPRKGTKKKGRKKPEVFAA
tara:strand:- start:2456 stop:3682 length:1227 start_codon:yes stop_codon:yes gene_type:complete